MWPDDDTWTVSARLCPNADLDAGFAVTNFIPGWMLPIKAQDDPPITLPAMPIVAGHVLTADAMNAEAELIHYFMQLPPLPKPRQRRETALFCSLEVNLVIGMPGELPIIVDTFAGSWKAARELLTALANPDQPSGMLYDNLDQGWALRIQTEADAVLVLRWDWEAVDGQGDVTALRLPRTSLAYQAIAARSRLDHLHGCCSRPSVTISGSIRPGSEAYSRHRLKDFEQRFNTAALL